jgi:hypothetical protein
VEFARTPPVWCGGVEAMVNAFSCRSRQRCEVLLSTRACCSSAGPIKRHRRQTKGDKCAVRIRRTPMSGEAVPGQTLPARRDRAQGERRDHTGGSVSCPEPSCSPRPDPRAGGLRRGAQPVQISASPGHVAGQEPAARRGRRSLPAFDQPGPPNRQMVVEGAVAGARGRQVSCGDDRWGLSVRGARSLDIRSGW